jgi:hypothetical protein
VRTGSRKCDNSNSPKDIYFTENFQQQKNSGTAIGKGRKTRKKSGKRTSVSPPVRPATQTPAHKSIDHPAICLIVSLNNDVIIIRT